jgi:hypothetical protein
MGYRILAWLLIITLINQVPVYAAKQSVKRQEKQTLMDVYMYTPKVLDKVKEICRSLSRIN